MGYDSVTAVTAVQMDVEKHGRKVTLVAMFMQIADSNLYVDYGPHNGAMSRSWNLILPQEGWRVMQEVVKMSASCEGGMLRYKGKSNTKAETLISACRKAIESAPKVNNLFDISGQIYQPSVGLRILKSDLDASERKKEEFEKLINMGMKYSDRGDEFKVDIPSTPEGMAILSEYSYLGIRWCSGTSGEWEFDQKRFERWAEPLREKPPVLPKMENGSIVSLANGIHYDFGDEKITKLKILNTTEKKNVFHCCGIREDGTSTSISGMLRIKPETIASVDEEGLFVKQKEDATPSDLLALAQKP